MAKVYQADAASVFIELMAEWKREHLDTAFHCGFEFVRDVQLELSDGEARKLAELLSIMYSEATIRISLIWREADKYMLRFSLGESLSHENAA